MKTIIPIYILVLSSLSLLSGQLTKDNFAAGNHMGGGETLDSFVIVLNDKDSYSAGRVIDAYISKASKHFRSGVDTLDQIYNEAEEYLMAVGQMDELGHEVYYSQAEIYYMLGWHNESLKYFKKTLEFESLKELFRNGIYLRVGEIYLGQDSLDLARSYFNQAADYIFGMKDSLQYTNIYLDYGLLASAEKKYITASEYYHKALEWADLVSFPMRKADILSKLASLYSGLDNPQKAKEYLEQVLAIATENGYNTMINTTKKRLSVYEIGDGNYELALSYLKETIPYFKKKKFYSRLIESHSFIADCYYHLNEFSTAEYHLSKAEEILDKIQVEQVKFNYYYYGGKFALNRGQLSKAEDLLNKAYTVAQSPFKANASFSSLELLVELYERKKDIRKELYYTKILSTQRDSIYNLNQTRLIFDYEALYQKAEQDLEIAQLNEENANQELYLKNKERQLIYSLLGLILALTIIIGGIYLYRLNKKSLRLLSEKNAIISKALANNKMLLKEIHHRVKNNLQVVSSLLFLQSRYIKDKSAKGAINIGRSRVQAMSILHQKLYQKDDVREVNVKEYFNDLSQNLFETYKIESAKVSFDSDIDDFSLDVDTVIPLGLITNELISNSLKHAFKKIDAGKIFLSIKKISSKIILTVRDNGEGVPFTTIPEKSESLGMDLIKSFSDKLNATLTINNNNGSEFVIAFEEQAQAQAMSA